jgi:hypothetical protein
VAAPREIGYDIATVHVEMTRGPERSLTRRSHPTHDGPAARTRSTSCRGSRPRGHRAQGGERGHRGLTSAASDRTTCNASSSSVTARTVRTCARPPAGRGNAAIADARSAEPKRMIRSGRECEGVADGGVVFDQQPLAAATGQSHVQRGTGPEQRHRPACRQGGRVREARGEPQHPPVAAPPG